MSSTLSRRLVDIQSTSHRHSKVAGFAFGRSLDEAKISTAVPASSRGGPQIWGAPQNSGSLERVTTMMEVASSMRRTRTANDEPDVRRPISGRTDDECRLRVCIDECWNGSRDSNHSNYPHTSSTVIDAWRFYSVGQGDITTALRRTLEPCFFDSVGQRSKNYGSAATRSRAAISLRDG